MKYNIIHIILLMIVGMACAVSCAVDPVALENGEKLQFEAMETATRAIITTNSNLKNKSFMLFGNVDRTGEYYQGLKTIFNGDEATYKNNKWDYGKPIYWLVSQEHSFVAIHPASIL